MKNLISMTDFVLTRNPIKVVGSRNLAFLQCEKYANFLKQKLELWMFVPCDKNNVPYKFDDNTGHNAYDREYRIAKELCLFDGFEVESIGELTTFIQKGNHSIYFTARGKININSHNERILEDVIKYDFELTASALKQIGL